MLLGAEPARAWLATPNLYPETARQDAPSRINEWCPVLVDERVDPEISAEYEGRRVYFCCRKCVKQFRAEPEAYTANLPTGFTSPIRPKALSSSSVQDHDGGEDSGHEHEPQDAQASGQEHDHAAHGDASAHGIRAWLLWIGRLHPMWVHFPIALLLAAGLAELLSARTRDPRFEFAARFSLWAGTIGALVAAPLGWADALGVVEEYTGTPATLLFYHRWAGTATAVVALLALALCERFHRGGRLPGARLHYRVAMLAAILLVTATGHLGASLIFGWDYLSN